MEFYPEDTQNFVLARKSKKKIEGSIILLLDLTDRIIVFFLKSPKIKLHIFLNLGKYALHLETKDN